VHWEFQQWCRNGTLKRLLHALAQDLYERGEIDISEAFIDGTFAGVKKGGSAVGKTKHTPELKSPSQQVAQALQSDGGVPDEGLEHRRGDTSTTWLSSVYDQHRASSWRATGAATPEAIRKERDGMRTARASRSGWCTLLILAIGLGSTSAAATNFRWSNPLPGFFSSAGNWSPFTFLPPGPDDTAIFNVSGSYTVSFLTSPTNKALFVRSGDVTFDIRATQTYTLTKAFNNAFVVGESSGQTASLTLINSSLGCLGEPCPGTLAGAPGPNGLVYLGKDIGSTGELVVGGGVVLELYNLNVGTRGSGSLTVNGGTLVLEGGGPTIGHFGTGALTISAGGLVLGRHFLALASIAHVAGSVGTATVTGPGSLWSGWSLVVGNGGIGTLNVDPGGTVSFQDITINGTVNLNGGTLRTSGELRVRDGSLLIGTGTVDGTIEHSGGNISPGLSLGALAVTGNYIEDPAATLVVELGGVVSGTGYDVLNVGFSCVLNGDLDIALIDGFTPSLGDSFEVLTCGSLTGGFAMIHGLALGGGLMLQPIYSANSLTLVAVQPVAIPALPVGGLLVLGGLLVSSALWALEKRPE